MKTNNGPDLRGMVAFGLFFETTLVLGMMGFNPKLAESQLFTALATAIVVSGLIGGVVAWLYGSSKGSDDKTAILAQRGASPPPTAPASSAPDAAE